MWSDKATEARGEMERERKKERKRRKYIDKESVVLERIETRLAMKGEWRC